MKNTFMLKRIAVITLVLFSLLVIIDFLPDSEAKPKSPLEGKEPAPIVDISDTSATQDLPPLPEFDIEPDSGGCDSEGCDADNCEPEPESEPKPKAEVEIKFTFKWKR